MKPFSWINRAWVLAIILGLIGASCTTRVSTNLRPPAPNPQPLTSKEPEAVTQARVQAAYGKLPLHFEPNQGQTDPQVKFLSRGSGYTLFLTPTEAVLSLYKPRKDTLAPVSGERVRVRGSNPEQTDLAKPETQNSQLETVLRMHLVGANPTPQVEGLEELPGKSNYFIGNDPKKWHTNIPTYARVKYQNVYPGIDLVYYGNQRQLEHDFIVTPGADPKAIKLAFEGMVGAHGRASLEIDAQGDLILQTAGGEVRLHKPRIYQEINGVKQPIPGGYVLLGPSTLDSGPSTHQVGFQLAAYDKARPLVIDPILVYSTFLGGSDGGEGGKAIAVDAQGNAYVTGETSSTDFPTKNPFQPAFGGGFHDAFVTKLNPNNLNTNAPCTIFGVVYNDCTDLIYSTYLGGTNVDTGFDIAVDGSGNAYVTGATGSDDFPKTPGAFDTTFNNGGAFVAKLNATGSSLLYSTHLGDISGLGIAVDSFGFAYVAGWTWSVNFPTTAGAFDTTIGTVGHDAFVTKLNPNNLNTNAPCTISGVVYNDCTDLIYSTYLGGSNNTDIGRDIAVDGSGNAYVVGVTFSTDFPTTTGAFDTTFNGSGDAFVAKIKPDPLNPDPNPRTPQDENDLLYSTFLGGSDFEDGTGIAVDGSGNAYVTGRVDSRDFPTTTGAFDTTQNGSTDAFVAKIKPDPLNADPDPSTPQDENDLLYSTFLGGSDIDPGGLTGVAVDSSGNAWVAGDTLSIDFPVTADAFDTTQNGGLDTFVTKLGPDNLNTNASCTISGVVYNDCTDLLYSTFLGGSEFDGGAIIAGGFTAAGNASIAVDGAGNAYVTNITASSNFPTTPGAFDLTLGGFADAFVAKIGIPDDIPDGAVIPKLGGEIVDSCVPCSPGPPPVFRVGPDILPITVNVSIDVLPDPGVSPPPGFIGPTTSFVDFTLDPNPGTLPDPGATIVLPLAFSLPAETQLDLFEFDPPSKSLTPRGIKGKVGPSGTTATFSGITKFSVFVGFQLTTVPFGDFDAKVEIEDDEFEVKATFTLGDGSDGIDPVDEEVSFQIGDFATTIPAGSFTFKPAEPDKKGKPGKPAEFKFEGVIDGVELEVKITDLGGGRFEFKAEGEGADLTGVVNPVDVELTIGDDGGSTTVMAEFEGDDDDDEDDDNEDGDDD